MLISLVLIGSGMAPVSAETAVIRRGDSGPDVVMLQKRLSNLGYAAGTTDGLFGRQTEAAVKAFQAANGLYPDGIVGDGTWSALRSDDIVASRGLGGSADVGQILFAAKQYQGVPYLWGGSAPDGFDCSGFTQYVFALHGIRLPRTADLQFEVGLPVRYDQLRPGDLVFFTTYAPGASHNGIYLGDKKFVSATSSRGVAIDRMNSSYWEPRYIGARRIVR